MIISASRRTDIPAHYSEWLFNRLREEYVLVRNPMNPHQIWNVNLSPDVVDGIVFWTKNPLPMMERIHKLDKYAYYFQFTLTPYERDIEPYLPSKELVILPAFQKLSQEIGRERVIWRYDPILFTSKYTVKFHVATFESMVKRLAPYTEKCIISFLDFYKNVENNLTPFGIEESTTEMQYEIMQNFSEIATKYGIEINICCENINLEGLNVRHSRCIDKDLFERISGYKLKVDKDENQRQICGCATSIDIGAYNTCLHGCKYCYANSNSQKAKTGFFAHDPASPLLLGKVRKDDYILERKVSSMKDLQMSLF